mmetsp:Transcript_5693/g.13595  ORF Transcript_5693/g.13595 Transcript_5693/m.13595 type:complete len:206 (+) Transcript_5693:2122-2739(+)
MKRRNQQQMRFLVVTSIARNCLWRRQGGSHNLSHVQDSPVIDEALDSHHDSGAVLIGKSLFSFVEFEGDPSRFVLQKELIAASAHGIGMELPILFVAVLVKIVLAVSVQTLNDNGPNHIAQFVFLELQDAVDPLGVFVAGQVLPAALFECCQSKGIHVTVLALVGNDFLFGFALFRGRRSGCLLVLKALPFGSVRSKGSNRAGFL